MTMIESNRLSQQPSAAVEIAHDANMKEGMLVTSLKPQDVLMGRGNGPNDHIGNGAFRYSILDRLDEYTSTISRKKKDKIARQVVRIVQSKNGRFVRKLSKGEKRTRRLPAEKLGYIVVKDSCAILKTKQAFRYVNKATKKFERNSEREGTSHVDTRACDVADASRTAGSKRVTKKVKAAHVTPGSHSEAMAEKKHDGQRRVPNLPKGSESAPGHRIHRPDAPTHEALQSPRVETKKDSPKANSPTNIHMLCDVAIALDSLGNTTTKPAAKEIKNDHANTAFCPCGRHVSLSKPMIKPYIVMIGMTDCSMELRNHILNSCVSTVKTNELCIYRMKQAIGTFLSLILSSSCSSIIDFINIRTILLYSRSKQQAKALSFVREHHCTSANRVNVKQGTAVIHFIARSLQGAPNATHQAREGFVVPFMSTLVYILFVSMLGR